MIIDSLNNRPKDQHVVITGRAASDALIDIADTVSEVKDIKHALEQILKRKKGLTFKYSRSYTARLGTNIPQERFLAL